MKSLETDPRLPAWLNALLNKAPFCIDMDSVRTIFAWAWDEQGYYTPGDASMFYNGYVMVRLCTPFCIALHVKPRKNLRVQFIFGWKLNGRFAITLRRQTDEQAAAGVLGPNLGQARGWERGTA